MDTILVKIFATALARSEVITEPQVVKTHFDPVTDRNLVVEIVRAGCAHMKQAFDIESINIDDLIATALILSGSRTFAANKLTEREAPRTAAIAVFSRAIAPVVRSLTWSSAAISKKAQRSLAT